MPTAPYSPSPSQSQGNKYIGLPPSPVAVSAPPVFSEKAQTQIARIDQLATRDLGPAMAVIEKSIGLMKAVATEQSASNRVGELISMMMTRLESLKPLYVAAGKRRRTHKKSRK